MKKIMFFIGLMLLISACTKDITEYQSITCTVQDKNNYSRFCEYPCYSDAGVATWGCLTKPNTTKWDLNASKLINSNPTYSLNTTSLTFERLNMSELTYNGVEVVWVYQIELPTEEYNIKILPCIKVVTGERYCEVE